MSNNSDNICSSFDSNYESSQFDQDMLRSPPAVNLPEKILFVIDAVRERNSTPFKLSKGANYMPLFMIKRVVEHFLSIKSTFQQTHEYGLVILNSQTAEWICNFTNNAADIIDRLNLINEEILEEKQEEEEEEEEVEEEAKEEKEKEKKERKGEEKHVKYYNLGQLFDTIEARLDISMNKDDIVVPMFVTRVILIYSRSNCVPKFESSKDSLEKLTKNSYFFIDVLYVHEPPCLENLCEKIYGQLATLDTKGFSYVFEVGRNSAKLHNNMAKLLAHPLQRPSQKDTCYTISLFSQKRTST